MILIPFLPLFFTLLIFVGFGVTVTLQVALAELLNVAVMYTFPADFAVIFPFLSTVAIFVLEDFHCTDIFLLFAGSYALSPVVLPTVVLILF